MGDRSKCTHCTVCRLTLPSHLLPANFQQLTFRNWRVTLIPCSASCIGLGFSFVRHPRSWQSSKRPHRHKVSHSQAWCDTSCSASFTCGICRPARWAVVHHVAVCRLLSLRLSLLQQSLHPTAVVNSGASVAPAPIVTPVSCLHCDGLAGAKFFRYHVLTKRRASVQKCILLYKQLPATSICWGQASWTLGLQFVLSGASLTSHAACRLTPRNKTSLCLAVPDLHLYLARAGEQVRWMRSDVWQRSCDRHPSSPPVLHALLLPNRCRPGAGGAWLAGPKTGCAPTEWDQGTRKSSQQR